jgi:hypothetical protein
MKPYPPGRVYRLEDAALAHCHAIPESPLPLIRVSPFSRRGNADERTAPLEFPISGGVRNCAIY